MLHWLKWSALAKKDGNNGNEYSNVVIRLDRLSLTSFLEGGHTKRMISIEFHSAYLHMHWMEVMQIVISLGAVLTCKGIGLVCLVL